jgi:hypothetical protein
MLDEKKFAILATIWEHISSWYTGKWVAYENPPGSGFILIGGYYQRHWTSRAAHVLVNFYLTHWQWVVGTALAIAALIVSIMALE